METTAMEDGRDAPATSKTAQIFGLVVALGLTTLFWWPSVASRLLPTDIVWRNVTSQLVDWVFCLALIGIVVFWERRPLSSLGFKPLTTESFFAGLGLGGFLMVGIALWNFGIVPFLPNLEGPTASSSATGTLPPHFFYWYAPFALLTASFCEEVIYRGYAMERVLSLTQRPWMAVLLPHLAFVLYHLKDGLVSTLGVAIFGLLFSLYYIRFRDLTMVIVAHAFVDVMAILGSLVGIGPK